MSGTARTAASLGELAPIRLRPISGADRPFLVELYASTRQAELAGVPWDERQRREFIEMQFAAQHAHYTTNYPGARLDVILVADERVGRLYVCPMPGEVRLMDIAILPQSRGQGIGTLLLDRLARETDEAGLPLTAHVEQGNPALGWYRRLGFEAVRDNGPYLLMKLRPSTSRPR